MKTAEKNYAADFLLQNKYFKRTIPLTTLICLALLLLIEHVGRMNFYHQGWVVYRITCYIQVVPVIILTSLSGYAMGAMVVLIFFVIEALAMPGIPYHAFVLLLASLISNVPVVYRWYKSFLKTVIAIFVLAIVTGSGWAQLYAVLTNKPLNFAYEIISLHFFIALPPSLFLGTFFYVYFNFLPKKFREYFYTGIYESDDYIKFTRVIRERKGEGISWFISRIIFIEAIVLLLAGFLIATGLLDEVGHFTDWEKVVFSTRLIILMIIIAAPILLFIQSRASLRISKPLILMSKAVEDANKCKISEHSLIPIIDLKQVKIQSKDEIGILYDALVQAIENTQGYIRNMEKEKILETKLTVAQAANKTKSHFLSSMSHEIRTPITAMLGFDEMIMRESSEEKIKEYAADIKNAGRTLLSLVNDILDFSKIEAGKLEIIPVEYSFCSMIQDLLGMVSKRAEDKKLMLNIEIDRNIPHLLIGDDVRIKQCILNILTNAIKYTPAGSVTLSISFEKKNNESIALTVHVIDTGIGIKEEDIPKLFDYFQRVDEKRNRTVEGTGLGISIVQSLLTQMNSSLNVISDYGKGSDFFFVIEQKVADWTVIGNFCETYKTAIEKRKVYKESFHAPEARVLFTDDTELNLKVIEGLLKSTRIKMDFALSGKETLELVEKNKYDIIFLDHRMPEMDGIETLQALKEKNNNLNKDVPVIALTANAIAGAKESYLAAGFTDYVTKPVEGEKLEEVLLKYLPENIVTLVQDEQDDEKEKTISQDIKNLQGINLEDALKFTGSEEILRQTLKEFYNTIDYKSEEIKSSLESRDIKNYTVLVHALKSSARLIGAGQLSEKARELEEAGDKNDLEKINSHTPDLLAAYKKYKEYLLPLFAENHNKEKISPEDFKEAVKNLEECIQVYDSDTADNILNMLDEYEVPEEYEEAFKKIKRAVFDADYARSLELINNAGLSGRSS
ncbi:ATP-binding protein [Treponema sp.]|uniref:ATP-binding protein n=1 Tax=Treponema sp. TaxID=166 RepID=UPI0025ECE24F|nr:ATP-binding protein [Treponema sp.]MCR5218963.1 response regulator [Treponema sp.]